MKALVLAAPGGIEQLRVQELPDPGPPGPGQALVRIAAVALNRLDLFVIGGLPSGPTTFPHVIGSDGAGTVQAVGEGVAEFRPGDRVMINPTLSCDTCPACVEGEQSLCENLRVIGEHTSGTAAELVVLPASNLALVPREMPWPQAAAFSLATLTVWRMLVTRARLQQSETVLIWGIGGGVAMAALQVARVLGARTIVTSRDQAKLETAKRMGADHLINSEQVDVPQEVRKLTGRRGVDVVVDSVGEQTWAGSLRSLRRGGRMVVCGATSGPTVSLDLRRLFWWQWSLLGSTLGSRREYAEIVGLAMKGQLWPVVDQVVPLSRATEAYARMMQGAQTGKLVIEVNP
jgi:NADPH:quinone reductase-like Zn-dependent oxidoreductase